MRVLRRPVLHRAPMPRLRGIQCGYAPASNPSGTACWTYQTAKSCCTIQTALLPSGRWQISMSWGRLGHPTYAFLFGGILGWASDAPAIGGSLHAFGVRGHRLVRARPAVCSSPSARRGFRLSSPFLGAIAVLRVAVSQRPVRGRRCARQDSNLRPRAPEARALSPELRAQGLRSVPV